MSPDISERRLFNVLFWLAVAGMGALFFTVPASLDDYWYMHDVAKGGAADGQSFSFLRGWFECVRLHHLTDNSRLANIIGSALVHLPTWISAAASTLAVALTLKSMIRLSGLKSADIPGMTVLVAMYVFAVPWADHLFNRIFTYNYVWGGALMTATAALFLRDKPLNCGLAFTAGLLLGAWHEIFSFPILCGAVTILVIHPKMRRRDRLWICAGLAIGGLWLFLSPSRTAPAGYASLIHYSRPFTPLFKDHIFTFIFLGIELICLCAGRRSRRAVLAPQAIFCVATSLISFAVHLLSYQPRTYTSGAIMEAVGSVYLLRAVIPALPKAANKALMSGCGLVWVFMAVHFAVSFATGIKINKEEHYIQNEYQKSKHTDGVVFADVTRPDNAPLLAFGKPYQHLYSYFAHSALVSEYHQGKMLKVIPKSLRSYRSGMGRKLGGDAGFRIYHRWVVAPDCSRLSEPECNAEFIYADGTRRHSATAYSFTGGDSKTYLFVLTDTEGLTAVNLPGQ